MALLRRFSFAVPRKTRTRWSTTLNQVFAGTLILAISVAFLIGIVRMGQDFGQLWTDDLEAGLRRILIDALVLLAVMEVLKTSFVYFNYGRIRVIYLVETVLIVMLSEVMTLWFKGTSLEQALNLILFLATLTAIRASTIYFSGKKWHAPLGA